MVLGLLSMVSVTSAVALGVTLHRLHVMYFMIARASSSNRAALLHTESLS